MSERGLQNTDSSSTGMRVYVCTYAWVWVDDSQVAMSRRRVVVLVTHSPRCAQRRGYVTLPKRVCQSIHTPTEKSIVTNLLLEKGKGESGDESPTPKHSELNVLWFRGEVDTKDLDLWPSLGLLRERRRHSLQKFGCLVETNEYGHCMVRVETRS